jgi:2-C-methyl-D-erythritol 2,4-cyclodiphosphate synthase
MLRHVSIQLSADGWQLENADLTIVAAEPRLAAFRSQMRQALAASLGCSVDVVSVKATTTDGLGAIGRTEGVLATATVLLSRNG